MVKYTPKLKFKAGNVKNYELQRQIQTKKSTQI